MRAKYTPHPSHIYENHYMRGGSAIGEYFKANAPLQYGGGIGNLLASIGKTAIPLLQRTVMPAMRKIAKRAIPIIKKEGKIILKSGLKEISDVLKNKQNTKQALKKNKAFIKKRVASMIDQELYDASPKRARTDIFTN